MCFNSLASASPLGNTSPYIANESTLGLAPSVLSQNWVKNFEVLNPSQNILVFVEIGNDVVQISRVQKVTVSQEFLIISYRVGVSTRNAVVRSDRVILMEEV